MVGTGWARGLRASRLPSPLAGGARGSQVGGEGGPRASAVALGSEEQREEKKIKAEHPKDVFIWARRARGGCAGVRVPCAVFACGGVHPARGAIWQAAGAAGVAGPSGGWCSVKQDFGYFQEQNGSVGMGLQRSPGAAGLKRLSPCLGVKAAAWGLSFSPHTSHPPCCLTALFLKMLCAIRLPSSGDSLLL